MLKLRKHIHNTDVALEVLRSYNIRNLGGHKLKVRWWNIVNPNNIYPILEDRIFIRDEDLKNWKFYEPKN